MSGPFIIDGVDRNGHYVCVMAGSAIEAADAMDAALASTDPVPGCTCAACTTSPKEAPMDPDTPDASHDIQALFAACEAEIRAVSPLIESWRSGNRTLSEILEPIAAHLKVIVSKAGELWPRIDGEGKREELVAGALVYGVHLVTGRDDLVPFIDDTRAALWLVKLVRGSVDLWRAKREAEAASPAAA